MPTSGSIIAIIVAVLGLFLSAFNSGSEIAYFSLRPDDVDDIEDQHRRERVKELLAMPEKLLATILVGNNLVNIMIAIVLNYAMNQIFDFNSTVLDFIVQTVILTFLILLFGEVIPKLYATNFNIKFAAMASAPLKAAVKLFSPLTALLVRSTSIVNKVVQQQTEELSVDDLTRALEVSEVKNPDEKELLEGILSFGDKTVSDIMRPRVDVVDIDQDDTFDEVVRKVIDTGYSRMPVYEETPDNIKGILYAKDLLPYIGNRDNTFKWQTLMRPAYFVPETRMLDDLLEDFRMKKMHMAIIVDEYGCTQGIATLEDVLEEIVGDINDEYDTEEKFYNRISKDTWLFDGKTLLERLCPRARHRRGRTGRACRGGRDHRRFPARHQGRIPARERGREIRSLYLHRQQGGQAPHRQGQSHPPRGARTCLNRKPCYPKTLDLSIGHQDTI